jgi:hypothetical protein
MTFASVRCHEEVSQAGRKRAISTYDVSLCVCVCMSLAGLLTARVPPRALVESQIQSWAESYTQVPDVGHITSVVPCNRSILIHIGPTRKLPSWIGIQEVHSESRDCREDCTKWPLMAQGTAESGR